MSSKAIKEKPESGPTMGGWQPHPEAAPSVMREDEPHLFRVVGFIGLLFLTVGGMALVFSVAGWSTRIGPVMGGCFTAVGIACLLFHAARDTDLQFRRTYLLLGVALVAVGTIASFVPAKTLGTTQFLPWGFLGFLLGLLFLLPATRNETDPVWRKKAVALLGIGGVALALAGFIGANASTSFLLPAGLLLALLGLGYLWAFVGLQGVADEIGYRIGLGIGLLGALVFLVALGRSVLPPLLYSWNWISRPNESYFASAGMVLMALGALYLAISAAICSDRPLAVLTRRELAAFFYSPIAYIVLFCFTLIGALEFRDFVYMAYDASMPPNPDGLIEPIIFQYIFGLLPVFVIVIVVPLLTMRLLSEEKRTGTLEVLLTAPVSETTVVMSKFLAALVFFLLIWVPWGLFLVALRVGTGEAFDYRPLLSFTIGLFCSGAGFLSMGVFFSALTRNQIASAVLTTLGMVGLLGIYLINVRLSPTSAWRPVLTSASFVDQWVSTLQGKLSARDIIVPLSSAILWLFMTVKVLEARKWQ